tara:strand:+ start:900 stop:4085 length:3186 start_codon:yes stop_codon:yes gene_type:complete
MFGQEETAAPVEGKRSVDVTLSNGRTLTASVGSQEELDSLIQDLEVQVRGEQHGETAVQEYARKADSILGRIIETPRGEFMGGTPVGTAKPELQNEGGFAALFSRGSVGGAAPVLAPGKVQSDNETALLQQAHAKGMDISTGAPKKIRFLMGALSTKDQAIAPHVLNEALKQHYRDTGVDYPEDMAAVLLDSDTGHLFYNRPITQDSIDEGTDTQDQLGGIRRTLLNDIGINGGDVSEYFLETASGVAEGAAAIGAAAATKNPYLSYTASASAGAAIASLTTPVRNEIIMQMTGLTVEEVEAISDPNEALKRALWAAGGETAGVAFIQGVRAYKQSGRFIKDSAGAANIIEAAKQNSATWDQVAELGIPVQRPHAGSAAISTSFRSGGKAPEVGVFATNAMRKLSPKNKIKADVQNLSARQNLDAGLMELTNGAISPSTSSRIAGQDARQGVIMPNGATGEQTVDATAAILNKAEIDKGFGPSSRQDFIDADEATTAAADKAGQKALKEGAPNLTASGEALTRLQKEVEVAHLDHKTKWGQLDELTGVDKSNPAGNLQISNPPSSPLNRALDNIEAAAEKNLSAGGEKRASALTEDLQKLRAGTIDFHSLQELDSVISHEIRKVSDTRNVLPYAAQDLKQIQAAINEQIDLQSYVRVKRPSADQAPEAPTPLTPADATEVHGAYRQANEATAYYRQVAQRDSIEGILNAKPLFDANNKATGEFAFTGAPHETVNKVLSNPRALNDVIDLAGHLPKLKAAFSTELMGRYKRTVIDANGQWQRGAHNTFMDKHADQVKTLWGKGETANFRNLEAVTAASEQASARAVSAEKLFSRRFGSEFNKQGGPTVDNITTHFLSGNTKPSQVSSILREVDKVAPDLAEGIRAEFAQKMINDISNNGTGMNPVSLTRYLKDKGGATEAVMGKKYVADLKVLAQASAQLDDAGKLSATAGLPTQAPWLQLTRSLLGPLSKKQRFLTAYNRMSRGFGDAQALEFLSDPAKIDRLIRLQKMDPTTRAAGAVFLSLGLEEIVGEDHGYNTGQNIEPITMNDLATLGAMHRKGNL